MKTALVHSDQYTRFDYGPEHPLRMERLGLTWRLMEAYGLTALAEAKVHAPEPADEAAISRFHGRQYLEVLKAVSSGLHLPGISRYGLGPGDNPVFPGLWDVACLVAGGSIRAAKLVADDAVARSFHFAGGLHHAMPDRASGFCYVNDAVLAILALRERGLRVCYVDIDAHHGDGVQFAFYSDPSVLTISTHERGDRLFPGTGFVEEHGEGAGHGYSVNVPLDPHTDDEVFHEAFEAVVPPLLGAFKPDVVVAQLGIDSHRTDPLTHLSLSVQGFAQAVQRIVELSPRLVALGGGGYDLTNVARAWTAAWAVMNGVALDPELPAAFAPDMRSFEFRSPSLWDPPPEVPAVTRRRAQEFARRQVEAIRRSIFPVHG
ncbi:MAG: acetoin utilization protein AcuC, partial [Candidatus Rokubacteria bacterium]|nr:acetoin utilization protein AcuC [Candidatus Rokubacteria bacterium]